MNSGSFWTAFGVKFNNGIDDLLEKENVTLEELLAHDDVIQDCKYVNAHLIEFLSRRDIVEKLIQYVIMSPPNPEDQDQKKPDKFPYVASELFECEVQSMLDALFENEDLLILLFSFLDRAPPLDPGCSSYFRKVVRVCINRKFDELKSFMVKHKIIEKLVNHIGLGSVAELLCCLGWEEKTSLQAISETSEWLYSENLVHLLVSRLDIRFEALPEVHANASKCICELLAKLGDSDQKKQSPIVGNRLVAHVKSDEILQQLFHHMLSGSASCMNHVLPIVSDLVIQCFNRRCRGVVDGSQDEAFLQMVLSSIPSLMKSFVDPPDGLPLTLPDGHLPRRFGFIRLKLLTLILSLLYCDHDGIVESLRGEDFLGKVINAMFEFPNNNMCHSLVEKIFIYILDSKRSNLKADLLKLHNLPQRIIDSYAVNAKHFSEAGNQRLGYMGHVFRLSEKINAKLRESEEFKELVDTKAWEVFRQDKPWQDELRIRSHELGGSRPRSLGEPEPIDVYSGYQINQHDDEDSDDDSQSQQLADRDQSQNQFRFSQSGQVATQKVLQTWHNNDNDSDSDEDDDNRFGDANPKPSRGQYGPQSDSDSDEEYRAFQGETPQPDATLVSRGSNSSDSSDSSDNETSAVIASTQASGEYDNLKEDDFNPVFGEDVVPPSSEQHSDSD